MLLGLLDKQHLLLFRFETSALFLVFVLHNYSQNDNNYQGIPNNIYSFAILKMQIRTSLIFFGVYSGSSSLFIIYLFNFKKYVLFITVIGEPDPQSLFVETPLMASLQSTREHAPLLKIIQGFHPTKTGCELTLVGCKPTLVG